MTILVLCNIVHFFTVCFLTANTTLKQIDPEFEAVSASMRVHFYKTFWRVTVPLSLPAILVKMCTPPQPQNWRIGPSLCGGLTLTHYQSFAHCPTLATLKTRIEPEPSHFPQWSIHVMMSQNASGELVLGDSHEYGLTPDPFNRSQINQWILDYLKCFAQAPSFDPKPGTESMPSCSVKQNGLSNLNLA